MSNSTSSSTSPGFAQQEEWKVIWYVALGVCGVMSLLVLFCLYSLFRSLRIRLNEIRNMREVDISSNHPVVLTDSMARRILSLSSTPHKIGKIVKFSESHLYKPDLVRYSSESNIGNLDSCSICIEMFHPEDQLKILDCNHGFHQNCVDEWLATSNQCPLCKNYCEMTV